MMGEAWAALALKVLSFVTDEEGLAELRKRQKIASLKGEIKDAIACKDFARAAAVLSELQRLSDAP